MNQEEYERLYTLGRGDEAVAGFEDESAFRSSTVECFERWLSLRNGFSKVCLDWIAPFQIRVLVRASDGGDCRCFVSAGDVLVVRRGVMIMAARFAERVISVKTPPPWDYRPHIVRARSAFYHLGVISEKIRRNRCLAAV